MKKLAILTLILSCAPAVWAKATSATYQVDAKTSEVRWLAKKVTGQHNGVVPVKSGQLKVANNSITGGKIVIDMTGITPLDTQSDKLTNHLKSDDFFGVEKFPTSTFEITGVKAIAGAKAAEPNVQVEGKLTVKGISHPLSFPATITIADKSLKASAQGVKVDRTLYNVRYGSGKFFENLGDKTIEDIFTIDFDLNAAR